MWLSLHCSCITCQLTVLVHLSLQPFGALWYTAGAIHSHRKGLICACRSSGEEGAVEVKSFHFRLYLSSDLWHFIQEPTVCLSLRAFLSNVMLTGSPPWRQDNTKPAKGWDVVKEKLW